MHGRFVLLVLLASCVVAQTGAATTPSGLHGTVLVQRTPVCVEGRACLEATSGVTLLFQRGGHAVARVTSRVAGAYRVRLPAGTYRVTVANQPRTRVAPPEIRVLRGVDRRVNFEVGRGLQ